MTPAHTLRRSPSPVAALLAAVVLAGMLGACGGSSSGGSQSGDIVFHDTPHFTDTARPDTAEPEDTKSPPDNVAPPQDSGGGNDGPRYEILFLVEEPVTVAAEDTRKIQIQVLDYTTASPADGAHIRLALDALDGGDASISANSVFTGRDGKAEFQFRANSQAPASYEVTATAVGARAEASIRIDVDPHPRGQLRVELTYGGQQPLTEIKIGVIEARGFQCSQYYPPSPPTPIEARTVLSVNSPPAVFDLPAGQRYSVWVTAKSRSGSTQTLRLSAAGCADAVYVENDVSTVVTVDIYDLVLNPAGLYDMVAVFDFTDAIPGEVGRIIRLITDAFWNPGQFVQDMVVYVIDLYLGQLVGSIVEWALSLFEDQIRDAINDWVFNSSPDWVQDIFTIGQDITQIVAQLELLADLRIAKLTNDYVVQGEENWIGLALYWRLGCPNEDEPGFDPECGRLELSMADIQNTSFPMDLVQGIWTGNIHAFDQLQISTHRLELNYGRLILFVINEILLPAISNGQYHDLLDAILGFVDCSSVADGIVGDFLNILGIDQADVEDLCVNSITLIVQPITLAVYGLGADSRIRLYGSAVLIDDNNDLIVDRIVDGIWEGRIELDQGGGNEGGLFSGEWEAIRK